CNEIWCRPRVGDARCYAGHVGDLLPKLVPVETIFLKGNKVEGASDFHIVSPFVAPYRLSGIVWASKSVRRTASEKHGRSDVWFCRLFYRDGRVLLDFYL